MKYKILVLIIIGIIILTGCNRSNETATEDEPVYSAVLEKNYLEPLSETIIGPDSKDYIIFIYGTYCSYCHALMTSDEFNYFTANPKVRFYQINSDNLTDEFIDAMKLTVIPAMILVDHTGKNQYEISKYAGLPDCIELIEKYTE